MSSLFISIMRQAFKTFDRANQSAFSTNFQLLKQLTEQLTFRDLQLSPQKLLNNGLFERPGRAPCTYMHIFENETVSMSVFVLRGDYTMPLHDHPCMYGLLRGIYGQLSVRSFSLAANESLYDPDTREVCVHAEPTKLVGPGTECAILTPRDRNFHEITAVDNVAAFFDILSPPYDADIPEYGSRWCRFYQLSAEQPTTMTPFPLEKRLLRLELIPVPNSYYCDTAEASEALLESTFICSDEAYSVPQS